MADIAIVALILLGAVIGFSKGFIVPVVAAGGTLLTISALYAGPLTDALPSGNFGLGASAVAIGVGRDDALHHIDECGLLPFT